MQNKQKIAVSEYFYSLQGEGRTMGIPAIFLRLTGCNLMCGGQGTEKDGKLHDSATWRCDTIEVWMKGTSYSFGDLVETMNQQIQFVERLKAGVHLVITGGEPLLQADRMLHFLEYLEQVHDCRPIVEVETNATIQPSPELDARIQYWNTSPKLSNSGMPKSSRIKPEILRWFAQNPKTMSKFVIAEKVDFEELQQDFISPKLINRQQIVLMPSADGIEELLEKNKLVAQLCIEHQLRMCTRLHVEVWNQLTGV